ncbi:hypothetical protein pb186bvf_004349 [Paramecium bursaria]
MSRDYEIFYNDLVFKIKMELNATISQAIENISQKIQISSSSIHLYASKKNGQPKLSFPPFQHDRLLRMTNQKRFSVVGDFQERQEICVNLDQQILQITKA